MITTFPEIHTIRDMIRFAATRFNDASLYFGHGTDNAWDEASALVLHCIHLPHSSYDLILDAHLIAEEKEKIFSLIEKRTHERLPLAYLTHEGWFAGLSFYIDERVLVPRSPIAELIENQFEPWINPANVSQILDLGTGSGCIAIACAKYFSNALVDAADISTDALSVAKINVLRHHLENEVTLYQSDLFHSLKEKKYDLIISNPPYVSAAEMETLPEEYRHEPKLGLTGGQEGIDIVTQILKQAHKYLSPHGILVVEVGNSEHALKEKFPHTPFTWLEFQRGGGGVFLLHTEDDWHIELNTK